MTTHTTPRDGAGDDAVPRPTRKEALAAAEKAWQEAEVERAKADMRAMKPWRGAPSRADKVLLGLAIGVPAVLMATMPLRPFLLADHPVLLAFLTGSHASVGAGAAFASIGTIPLWLIIVAGVVGKIKIDWLLWLIGRRWGKNIVRFLVQGERGRELADRAKTMNPWIMRTLIPLSYLPGIPTGIPHVLAGATGMRLRTYLLLDALGALLTTVAVAAIGLTSGQAGVDLVLLIDKYALWCMLAIIFGMAAIPVVRSSREQKARRAAALSEAAEAYDAETARIEAAGH